MKREELIKQIAFIHWCNHKELEGITCWKYAEKIALWFERPCDIISAEITNEVCDVYFPLWIEYLKANKII